MIEILETLFFIVIIGTVLIHVFSDLFEKIRKNYKQKRKRKKIIPKHVRITNDQYKQFLNIQELIFRVKNKIEYIASESEKVFDIAYEYYSNSFYMGKLNTEIKASFKSDMEYLLQYSDKFFIGYCYRYMTNASIKSDEMIKYFTLLENDPDSLLDVCYIESTDEYDLSKYNGDKIANEYIKQFRIYSSTVVEINESLDEYKKYISELINRINNYMIEIDNKIDKNKLYIESILNRHDHKLLDRLLE